MSLLLERRSKKWLANEKKRKTRQINEVVDKETEEEVGEDMEKDVGEENDGEVGQTVEKEVEQQVREEHVEEEVEQQVGEEHVEEEIAITKKKRTRGLTKMQKMAKDPLVKVDVQFTTTGEHYGPGSVTLSSFLGPLVREHVSVLLEDWRQLDDQTEDILWEEIQGKFNLTEEWQKDAVFQQMGCLWRASRYRLVSQLRAAKSNAVRLNLKPSNIRSIATWNTWVKNMTSPSFQIRSNKYRELKRAQIPHTKSRKGMFRLSQEMKEKSSDPRQVTRSKVWLAGHTYTDGTPVRLEFADTFEKIQSVDSQMDSTSCDNVREDAVSQVLGKDKCGRVRGLGRGVTITKLAFRQGRDSKVENLEAKQLELISKVDHLNNVVRQLAGKRSDHGSSQSEISDVNKGGIRCQLLDWYAVEDIVVGEAEFCSAEPTYKIGRIPLGPNAAAVIVKSVVKTEASLWRPTQTQFSLEDVVGVKIPWPVDKVILDDENSTRTGNKASGSSGTNGNESIERCQIYDWNSNDCVIAEGVMCSTDQKEMVNNIPLGPNAVIMMVDAVLKPNAFLWRPTVEMFTVGDALNAKIAWPVHKIQLLKIPTQAESVTKPPPATASNKTTASKRTSNTNGNAKKKCIMFECNNYGRIVAEGRVCSTDPEDRVHFVPLGPNASKVWIEVSKISDAGVWRPNSKVQFISDAVGTTVAWPNDKIRFI
ncbi:unnamed protein product [Brassica oleracea var. botrytis]|uniref:uncharacterized protein LOC106317816 isoform X1 n=1 Tax=Brassica oleracea var. oleracea TaxID=109376 RepID=UPI0006A6D94F|nr:PREDICTED: uncharacterized protein LOC106317816 isoform X1 [Brassica oleracea var. oleracea]XP_013611042.1 PREDICTED: uncharacterized protein LOC106317816 isoform X1 [Brassica oleracea var. oleracea]